VTCGSSDGPHAVDETHRPAGEFTPPYFVSKAQQEDLALDLGHRLGLQVVVACPTVVLGGPATRLVPSNALLARYLGDLTRSTYPGGCNVVAAPDVGTGHALLAEDGEPGQRYLLGGRNLTWRAFHELVSDLAGIPGPFTEVNTATAVALAGLAQQARRVGWTAPVTVDEARTVGRYYWYRHDRAAALGYAPGDAPDAVAQGLSWLLASPFLARWVRDTLRPRPQVYAARALVPRPLDGPADAATPAVRVRLVRRPATP
jgi:dihydroflavonol-4-reductase